VTWKAAVRECRDQHARPTGLEARLAHQYRELQRGLKVVPNANWDGQTQRSSRDTALEQRPPKTVMQTGRLRPDSLTEPKLPQSAGLNWVHVRRDMHPMVSEEGHVP
jgi:hypothetical protein